MVGGGAQHADTIDLYLTGKVARLMGWADVADLRDHRVWLMKRRGRHGLCQVATARAKATLISNLIIVSSRVMMPFLNLRNSTLKGLIGEQEGWC